MTSIRERAEKLQDEMEIWLEDILLNKRPRGSLPDLFESVFLSVRNEALEDAAYEALDMCSSNYTKRGAQFGHEIKEAIQALKSLGGSDDV